MRKCGDIFKAASHGVEVFIRFWRPYFGFSPQVVTSQTYILDKSYLMQFIVFSCYVRCRNAVVTVLARCDSSGGGDGDDDGDGGCCCCLIILYSL